MSSPETESGAPPYPSGRRAWYTVGVLMTVYVFSFVDRQILSLLVGPMKRDLGLTDTEVSLLMGLSFALFYTVCGIPLGRIADSRSRRGLIGVGLVLWSLTTTACGSARSFAQLLLLRMGVGVGEAALSPAAYSLITDSFPPHRLATAISVYSMGIYIGSGMAFLLGGLVVGAVAGEEMLMLPLVGAVRPWQVVFFIVGLPGLGLSLLLLTVREPARRDARGAIRSGTVPLREVREYLRGNWRTFFCHNVGFALLSFSSYGSGAWIPTFLQRTHGMSVRESGIWYGAIVMVAGTLGVVSGGWLADRLSRRGSQDARIRAGLIASLVWLPVGVLFPLVPSPELALAMLAPAAFASSMPFGCAAAAVQEMVPGSMRGQASALYLFVVNLIGLGLGPTVVALFTDYIFADDAMLRYSLLIVATSAHLLSALLLWSGLAPFRATLQRLHGLPDASAP